MIDLAPDPDSAIERAYVRGSGTALSHHRMKFLNRSTNMTLIVQLKGPKPIRFVTARTLVGDVGIGGLPANGFELATRETKEIDVVFISSELDPLPEGLIRTDVLVGVSAGTITLSKDADDTIDIGPPDATDPDLPDDPVEPPPPPPPPTPTWRDCSKGTARVRDGFPPSDWTIRADGCYVPPAPELPPIAFTISSIEFQPGFDGSTAIARAQLKPVITGGIGDWKWQWNFDINRQGPGTGDDNDAEPKVSWRMTEEDIRNLQDNGRTTRVVEALARRNIGLPDQQIVRLKHTVIIDHELFESIADLPTPEGGRDDEELPFFFGDFDEIPEGFGEGDFDE